jgi:hypothetical protein
VHFMRRPGVGPDPVPLICTHGWPWTFWHRPRVIDPLAVPGAHGGDPAEGVRREHPLLPRLRVLHPAADNPDMNFSSVADLWHTLMTGVLCGVPKSVGQWPSSSCLACCPNMLSRLGLPSVALGEAHHTLRR